MLGEKRERRKEKQANKQKPNRPLSCFAGDLLSWRDPSQPGFWSSHLCLLLLSVLWLVTEDIFHLFGACSGSDGGQEKFLCQDWFRFWLFSHSRFLQVEKNGRRERQKKEESSIIFVIPNYDYHTVPSSFSDVSSKLSFRLRSGVLTDSSPQIQLFRQSLWSVFRKQLLANLPPFPIFQWFCLNTQTLHT